MNVVVVAAAAEVVLCIFHGVVLA